MSAPTPPTGYAPCVECGRETYWRTLKNGEAVPVCGEGVGHNLGGHFEIKFVPDKTEAYSP